jgi:predicted outer membrane repeat protein
MPPRLLRRRPHGVRAPGRRRPVLEVLEDRYLLSTLTVLNLNDSGAGSLRQAIANAAPGDTINFAISGQITLTSGPLFIEQDLTITGPGPNALTISGNNATEVLNVGDVNLSISGLTIANGVTSGSGGAINMFADPSTALSLTNCVFANDVSLGGNGGAIETRGDGPVNITDCSFLNNSAPGNGGAIDSPGIFLTVTDSTFFGNSAGNGGAISIGADSASITNCTFDSNSASGEAGAVYSDFACNYSFTNCTLTRNSANTGGGLGLIGGSFTLINTIVAGNSASTAPDVSGPVNSEGNNLVGITDGSSGWTDGDLTGMSSDPLNALLGPLGNYGGPTLTDPLLPGSPAIGNGNGNVAPSTDQRGDPRSTPSDMGAVQLLEAVVTNTNDSGPGSLRQAILDTNAHPGDDYITFAIPGAGVHVINLQSALPEINDTVNINGYTQAGSSPNTLPAADNAVIDVEINGGDMAANGLVINNVTDCVISGLSIVGFGADSGADYGGIEILGQPADSNLITGNFLGVLPDGTTADANADGIILTGDPGLCVVGGTDPADRNILSGNVHWGFILDGSGDTIEGNLIGLDATGLNALGNGNGGVIDQQSMGDVIGGTTPAARNYIAGNVDRGLKLTIDHTSDSVTSGPEPMDNVIEGNWIGLNIDGVSGGGQVVAGIELRNVSSNSIGVAGAGNVISGNAGPGIEIVGSNAVGNSVQGNLIGTDPTGTSAVPNAGDGVDIDSGALSTTVGGTGAGQGNVISGNAGNGVVIGAGVGPVNTVEGDLIGLNAAGTAALGNAGNGIVVLGGIATLIGGPQAGAGNVISGNAGDGVQDSGDPDALAIQGNIIGLNAAGTAAVANAAHGIQILDAGDTVLIGGDATADRNVISGNADHGINVHGSNVTIVGNYIGTDVTGMFAIGNGASGIGLDQGSGNVIGDTSANGGNVISGNGDSGIEFYDGSDDNTVVHNLIGTAANGTSPLGNGNHGIHFDSGGGYANSSFNIIGTLATNGGNVIAFSPDGVQVDGGNANEISGNSIFGNTGLGILLDGGNDGLAAPTITAVGVNNVVANIVGTPGGTFRIEVFATPAGGPAGQGQTLIGTETIGIGGSGVGNFDVATMTIAPGLVVSATVTELSNPFIDDTSEFSQYVAAPLPLAGFQIIPSAFVATAGQAQSITVRAVDANGTVLTDYQGTVTFASTGTDGGPTLPAQYSFTAADAGVHTFSVTYFTAGPQTLTVSDVLNMASGSASVQVVAGAFYQLLVSGLLPSTPVGVENDVTVEAVDKYGNVVSSFNDTLHFTSNDSQAQLPANSKLTNGVGIFDVTFRGLLPLTGNVRVYSVTVTDTNRMGVSTTEMVDLPLYLLPFQVQFVQVQNVAFTHQLVATFLTDLARGFSLNANDFSATIDWGDGSDTTQGTIVLLPGGTTFAVYGDHTYPTGQTDYPVDVMITYLGTGYSSMPITPSVAAVVTAAQFANLGQNSVVRALVGQTSLVVNTSGADANLTGANGYLNTTLFVANYNNNPQVGTTVAGVSFYDIRATNTAGGATLTVTFRFPTGHGIPELEFFDPATGTYVEAVGVTESAPVAAGPGMEAITFVFGANSFPTLSSLQGSVFTIVIDPTEETSQTTLSPALSLAYPVPAALTVTRDVTFQGSGIVAGLTPSNDATHAAARADLSGGGDDNDPSDEDLDLMLQVLGFAPTNATPVLAPVAAPPAAPPGAGVSGPGAALPVDLPAYVGAAVPEGAPNVSRKAPALPADILFAAAAERPFVFAPRELWKEPTPAESPRRESTPCLLAAPLFGALATQPPLRTRGRKRGRTGAFPIG